MFKRIVLTTDLSDASWTALPSAMNLAALFDCPMTVLAVLDEPYYFAAHAHPVDSLPKWNDEYFATMSDHARKNIDERLMAANARASVDIRQSRDVTQEILSAAGKDSNSLVVMATHGRSGWSSLVIGSIAERVVRLSQTPVLTVRVDVDDENAKTERILFTTDLSEESWSAFAIALELAKRTECQLTVLCVIDDKYYLHQPSLGDAWSEAMRASQPNVQAAISHKLTSIAAAENIAIQVEDSASASQTIIDIAKPSDLVVMATHGRSGVRRMLLGSTTEQVVRRCKAPVMTVHSG